MHGWNDNYAESIKESKFLRQLFRKYNRADGFIVLGEAFKQKLISFGISPNKKFFLETIIADNRYISDFSIEDSISNFNNEDRTLKFLFISRKPQVKE